MLVNFISIAGESLIASRVQAFPSQRLKAFIHNFMLFAAHVLSPCLTVESYRTLYITALHRYLDCWLLSANIVLDPLASIFFVRVYYYSV